MGKGKLNESVHEIGSRPGSQVWEKRNSLRVSQLHPGPGSTSGLQCCACGKEGRRRWPVSASILLSHVLRLRLQLEAHSSASGWPGLRADATLAVLRRYFRMDSSAAQFHLESHENTSGAWTMWCLNHFDRSVVLNNVFVPKEAEHLLKVQWYFYLSFSLF